MDPIEDSSDSCSSSNSGIHLEHNNPGVSKEKQISLRIRRDLQRPYNWRDSLNVLFDPYQFVICHYEDPKDCWKVSATSLYCNALYMAKEWRLLSSLQVERILSRRDSELQSFTFNKQGKIAMIYRQSIILSEGVIPSNTRHANHANPQLRLTRISNDKHFFHFIAPSYKFSDVLIAANRKSVYLLKQVSSQSTGVTTLEVIKEYSGISAETGRFSRDGKYFVCSNTLSHSISIIDLFTHKVYSRSVSHTSISHMGFSKSGLHFFTACADSRTLTIFECVLWEKASFSFPERIVFAEFLGSIDGSVASGSAAAMVIVVLQSGQIRILKDMQFNMLNAAAKRINFEEIDELVEGDNRGSNRTAAQIVTQTILPITDSEGVHVVQAMLVENFIFVLAQLRNEGEGGVTLFSINLLESDPEKQRHRIDLDDYDVNENTRFFVNPTKLNFEITIVNPEQEFPNKIDIKKHLHRTY